MTQHDPEEARIKHNARMNEELEKIKRYRQSIEEEYATMQGKQIADNVKAKSIFADNIHHVAEALVSIAIGKHPDAKPATMVKAGIYIYDRVILKDDDPRKDEMQQMLDTLSRDPTDTDTEAPVRSTTNDGTPT